VLAGRKDVVGCLAVDDRARHDEDEDDEHESIQRITACRRLRTSCVAYVVRVHHDVDRTSYDVVSIPLVDNNFIMHLITTVSHCYTQRHISLGLQGPSPLNYVRGHPMF